MLFSNISRAYDYKKSFIVFEIKSKKTIKESFINRKVFPASLTKILTAHIIFRDTKDIRELTTISKKAWGHRFENSSRMFLEPRTEVTINSLLTGLLVQSGNDAAVALAEYHSGTVKRFVKEMNRTAKELGMSGSNFTNPNGRHNRKHYTTASDFINLIIEVDSKTPQIYDYTTIKQYEYNDIIQYNSNKTLKNEKAIGLKTGFTPQSGFNLASCYKINNGKLCTLEFGSNTSKSRFTRSFEALDIFAKNNKVYETPEIDKKIEIENTLYKNTTPLKIHTLIKKTESPIISIKLETNTCAKVCPAIVIIETDENTINKKIILEKLTNKVKQNKR
jgi:D-alanyl-D-alanine carboxypeptidase (penicillin-binding protein 5/6)